MFEKSKRVVGYVDTLKHKYEDNAESRDTASDIQEAAQNKARFKRVNNVGSTGKKASSSNLSAFTHHRRSIIMVKQDNFKPIDKTEVNVSSRYPSNNSANDI